MAPKDILYRQACPMLASVQWNPEDDTEADTLAFFNEFDVLTVSIRLGLVNEKVREAVLLLAKGYKIEDLQRVGEISRIIREVFIRGIRENVIMQRINSKLGLTGEAADKFSVDLRRVVAFVKKVGKEEFEKEFEEIDLLAALKKYEQMRRQQVTSRPIKVRMSDVPVDPTIQNWLEDYFSQVGTDKHTAIQRTEYLFNSVNGSRLPSVERDKLGILLKAYDEHTPLVIDKESQEILFTEGMTENNEKQGIATPIEEFDEQEKMAKEMASEDKISDEGPTPLNYSKAAVSQVAAVPAPASAASQMPQEKQTIGNIRMEEKVMFKQPKLRSMVAARPVVFEAVSAPKPAVGSTPVQPVQSGGTFDSTIAPTTSLIQAQKSVMAAGSKPAPVLPSSPARPAVVRLEPKNTDSSPRSAAARKNVIDLSEYM